MTEVHVTKRQEQIYKIIVKAIHNGRPPTIRELGAATGINSPNGIMCHLKALEKKGLITRIPGVSRGIGIAGMKTMLVTNDERKQIMAAREAK